MSDTTNQPLKSYALVVMSNGDVYYAGKDSVQLILETIEGVGSSGFIAFNDVKSGDMVMVSLKNISSVVVRGGGDGEG